MGRHTAILALVPVLVLAGCIGGPVAEADPSDSTVSPERVPGVTNGTLSNASALVEANRDRVTTNGAILQVNRSSDRMSLRARLVVGADFSTHSLSGTATTSGGQSTTVDRWGNETAQFLRTASGGETTYRVLGGHDDRLALLSPLEEFLSAGAFEVAPEAGGDGVVVLTADGASTANTSIADGESFEGRLAVDESGQIRTLSVTGVRDGEPVTYSYELRQAGVDRVPKPDWIDDVPPGATVQARLSVDVANGSYLALEHSGGDTVPSATTVRVESNGTVGSVRLDDSLRAGDTRYVYFEAESGTLRAGADRPEPGSVSPVTSPVSVRITTEGGAPLYSASMAWESASASDGGDGAGGSTGGSDSAGASSESTTAESASETPSAR